MLKNFTARAVALPMLFGLLALLPASRAAQDTTPEPTSKTGNAQKTVKITIQVTGGEDKTPVDSASVYVRFVEARKIGKDKQIEMNLKTNLSGICHVPEIPAGKVVIQVIAPGWKTFGENYDLDQAEQTVNISLTRPPKWY
jgi:hypothetical protein